MHEVSTPVTCIHAMFTQDGLFAIMSCTEAGDTLHCFFVHEVPIPATGDSRDGWEEHGWTEVEGFKNKYLASLKDATGEWGVLYKSVVRQTKTPTFCPIFSIPLGTRWSRGRCILLGDAGHAMEPHTGQGVSMELEDVFLLSRLLEAPYANLSDIFEKFDELRRPRIVKLYNLAAIQGINKKKYSSWALGFKEIVLRGLLWAIAGFEFFRRGFDEKHLPYDIDEVMIYLDRVNSHV
jgi:2-polyprenyl-6-methoxyphenol hydroxylase-like FAD-dependent oxidoreductase